MQEEMFYKPPTSLSLPWLECAILLRAFLKLQNFTGRFFETAKTLAKYLADASALQRKWKPRGSFVCLLRKLWMNWIHNCLHVSTLACYIVFLRPHFLVHSLLQLQFFATKTSAKYLARQNSRLLALGERETLKMSSKMITFEICLRVDGHSLL